MQQLAADREPTPCTGAQVARLATGAPPAQRRAGPKRAVMSTWSYRYLGNMSGVVSLSVCPWS